LKPATRITQCSRPRASAPGTDTSWLVKTTIGKRDSSALPWSRPSTTALRP
jgi:hypothetical protein